MTANTIEFRDVSKKLGNKQVLNKVLLSVGAGDVVGIVGANGTGKTTLLRLVSGLMYPDHGEVLVSGKKVYPGLVGCLPVGVGALIEAPTFLPQFSGLRNLTMLANIQGLIDNKAVRGSMKRVGLDPDSRKAFRTYSLGMRQRLGIAQAIMEQPGVLLLDEPTNGLDQEGTLLFADIMKEQVERGAAILIVSHLQEEINRYCEKVYSLEEGNLVPVRKTREREWVVVFDNLEDLERTSQLISSFRMNSRINNKPTGTCKGEWETKEELLSFLTSKGVHPVDIQGGS